MTRPVRIPATRDLGHLDPHHLFGVDSRSGNEGGMTESAFSEFVRAKTPKDTRRADPSEARAAESSGGIWKRKDMAGAIGPFLREQRPRRRKREPRAGPTFTLSYRSGDEFPRKELVWRGFPARCTLRAPAPSAPARRWPTWRGRTEGWRHRPAGWRAVDAGRGRGPRRAGRCS